MCSIVGHSSLPHCTEERSPQRVTRALMFIAPVIFETLGVVHRHILHCVVRVAGEPFLIFYPPLTVLHSRPEAGKAERIKGILAPRPPFWTKVGALESPWRGERG